MSLPNIESNVTECFLEIGSGVFYTESIPRDLNTPSYVIRNILNKIHQRGFYYNVVFSNIIAIISVHRKRLILIIKCDKLRKLLSIFLSSSVISNKLTWRFIFLIVSKFIFKSWYLWLCSYFIISFCHISEVSIKSGTTLLYNLNVDLFKLSSILTSTN